MGTSGATEGTVDVLSLASTVVVDPIAFHVVPRATSSGLVFATSVTKVLYVAILVDVASVVANVVKINRYESPTFSFHQRVIPHCGSSIDYVDRIKTLRQLLWLRVTQVTDLVHRDLPEVPREAVLVPGIIIEEGFPLQHPEPVPAACRPWV